MYDPKGWITINEFSGSVETSKTLDREAANPRGALYNVTVLAIDKGKTLVFKWYVIKELENKLHLFSCRIIRVLSI